MRLITTQKLIDTFGEEVKTILAPLGQLDILPTPEYNSIKLHCDSLPLNEEILLVGGPDIVPYAILSNPADDPDDSVPTDNPYACTTDPLYFIPNKSIGRLPTESSLDYLRTVVAYQIAFNKLQPTAKTWLNIVASVWVGISEYMKNLFTMDMDYPSPPLILDSVFPDTAVHAYLNLHGSKDTPFYYGQQGDNYPIVLGPKLGQFKGMLVFAEACYGGYLNGRTKDSSIPMMGLYSGAIAFVASTNTAYGPPAPPSSGADLLFELFTQNVTKGFSLGISLMLAKQQFAAKLIAREHNISPPDKKTLLQFHLLGSPTIILT